MDGKMRAIMKKEPKPGAVMETAEIPKIRNREVLVKIKAASICGTDLHIYEWDEWARSRIHPPMIFGHEFAGEVIEAGKDVTFVSVGDHVSGETHLACGHCFQCRTGQAHVCRNVRLRGVDVTGCFSEYHAMPEESAWKNDKKVPHWVASAQEPLGNAVHTVFDGEVAGKTIAIFGCGPIGMCAAALCRASGAERIFAVDINPYRVRMAKEMGAHVVLNGKETDVVKEIMGATDGDGVDVFLEMSGSPVALKQGLKVLKPGGRASILGIFSKPVELNITDDIVFKAARINGINGRRMFGTWFTTSAFLRSGLVNLEKIITHKFKFEEFEKAFALMKSGNCGKVVMTL
ncbi:MAG: L-threonine 3-dehydrogenase [Candidatus Micrarchaeota archaeon]